MIATLHFVCLSSVANLLLYAMCLLLLFFFSIQQTVYHLQESTEDSHDASVARTMAYRQTDGIVWCRCLPARLRENISLSFIQCHSLRHCLRRWHCSLTPRCTKFKAPPNNFVTLQKWRAHLCACVRRVLRSQPY